MKKIFLLLLPQLLLAGALFSTSCSKNDAPSNPDPQPAPSPQEIQSTTFTVNGISFNMMLVKAGTFTMGATPEQENPNDDESPAHQVTLTHDYYLGETEVTQALWMAVMGDNPSHFTGDNLPVEQVSWNDCQEFIRQLNASTGLHFRLPSEAEWEFAARGGNNSRGYQYVGGNDPSDAAWYSDISNYETHPVKAKRPNELGLYDMAGNVWEWCQDGYGPYGSTPQTDPSGPTNASYCVDRGGSWFNDAWSCRVSKRGYYWPDNCNYTLGLRLALSE